MPTDVFDNKFFDASHFNREYKSLFGVSPMRDVQRLRGEILEIVR